MNRKRLMALGAISVIGLGTAGGVYAANQMPSLGGAQAASVLVGSMGHGWHGKRHHGGPGHFCAGARGEKLEHAIDFVQSFVDFTPEQVGAWQGLVEALRGGSDTVGASCSNLTPLPEDATAPERLAQVELVASTGLEVLREVRPAFDALYAVLDEDQKAALDGLINRRRH